MAGSARRARNRGPGESRSRRVMEEPKTLRVYELALLMKNLVKYLAAAAGRQQAMALARRRGRKRSRSYMPSTMKVVEMLLLSRISPSRLDSGSLA